jgi:hypothetical protein
MSQPQFDEATLSKLSERDLKVLIWRQKWLNTAREKQLPPDHLEWLEWILCSGRGFGKTLSGAQWMGFEALIDPEHLPSCVIAPTLNDIRYTCFEGHTGLITLLPKEIIADYNKTNLILTLDNGSIIRGFSAEEPERLRGPQHARGWLEEVGAWGPADEDTFDMFMMGLRLGPRPRFVCTTTPKPRELIRTLTAPKTGRIVVGGSTYENRANLPQSFFDQLAKYEGTQLGRQELEGEIIDAEEGAIIARKWIKLWPLAKPLPRFEYLILSFDTGMTEKVMDRKSHDPDPTACVALGAFWNPDSERNEAMVLDAWDETLGFPDLLARVKKEMKIAYGDDVNARPVIRPLIGSQRIEGTGRKPDILLIEDKGSGISLRQQLEREGVPVYPYNPGNADKAARLHIVSHLFAQGLFWVPESAKHPGKFTTWAEPMVAQLCSFRGSGSIKHDDYVDALSQGMRLLNDKSIVTGIKQSREKREKERDAEAVRELTRKTRENPYAQ